MWLWLIIIVSYFVPVHDAVACFEDFAHFLSIAINNCVMLWLYIVFR